MKFRNVALAILMLKSLELLMMHVATVADGDDFMPMLLVLTAIWLFGWSLVWAAVEFTFRTERHEQ